MLTRIENSPLYKIVNPKRIAFFGASNRLTAMGSNICQSIIEDGYKGTIYPVHPQDETVMGLKAYKHVADIEDTPDLAVIVLPTHIVIDTMEEIGKKGIKHAIIVTAGFKEVGGEGIALEKKLVETARKYGIRFVGPNCIGVTNPHISLNSTFLRMEGKPGFIGLASQSGSFVTQFFHYLHRIKQGFSTAFSVGNSADIDLVDCIEYLGECPHTKVIALYIEGIDRGRAFVEMARTVSQKKPIVAMYAGGSETGRKATFSHTGTLAGPDRLYDGIFRQSGVIRARSIIELFDMCRALGSLPIPKGNQMVIQTHSGGPGAAAADACGREGIGLPGLTQHTLNQLSKLIPHTGSINNPVDITYSKNPMDFFMSIPQALIKDENTDMLLVYYLVPDSLVSSSLNQGGVSAEEIETQTNNVLEVFASQVVSMMEESGKPIAGFTFRSLDELFPQKLMAHGVPVFSGPERAVRAMKSMVTYGRLKEKIARQLKK